MKRLSVYILLAALCLCLLPVGAAAADDGFLFADEVFGEQPYYLSAADGADHLREQLMDRQEHIEVRLALRGEEGENWSSAGMQMYDAALEATDDPHSGDYLGCHIIGYEMGVSCTSWADEYYITATYEMTYASTAEQEAAVDGAIETLIDSLGLQNMATDYDRICAIYGYICDHVTYDYEGLSVGLHTPHSCYAALIENTAVCQGYAGLLCRMLTELGIENRIVSGRAEGANGLEEHAWNIVRLGDLFYQMDVTWDAGRTPAAYSYFLRGSDSISSDHLLEYIGPSMGPGGDISEYPLASAAYAGEEPAPPVVTGSWKQNSVGWWYDNGDGTYPVNEWKQINGVWYYFKGDGYMAANEWVGGYWLNANGTWTYQAKGGWRSNDKGWWYEDSAGWYPRNTWQKIDGQWYFFKANGYMAAKEWYNGYWFGASGAWTYQPRGSWQQNNTGWWFGDTSGWYAKNETLKINDVLYTFNAAGYWVQ